jgi:hypothetical protein
MKYAKLLVAKDYDGPSALMASVERHPYFILQEILENSMEVAERQTLRCSFGSCIGVFVSPPPRSHFQYQRMYLVEVLALTERIVTEILDSGTFNRRDVIAIMHKCGEYDRMAVEQTFRSLQVSQEGAFHICRRPLV